MATRPNRAGKLPPKRKTSMGPAPVFQIKVSLYGTEPLIWRRLEVRGDTSLRDLHGLIQTVFGWEDSHLHLFETLYGEFADPDHRLGHQSERRVTLEQVAPQVGSEIIYRYDFGDDWQHLIQVEKIAEPEPSVAYPRCTDGRRAGPPEDCGGVWGYEELLGAIRDPLHPDHEDRLEWLGIDRPEEFDADDFDAGRMTMLLAALAKIDAEYGSRKR